MRLKLAVLPLVRLLPADAAAGELRRSTPTCTSTSTPGPTLSPGSTKGSTRRSLSPREVDPLALFAAAGHQPGGRDRRRTPGASGAHPSGPARRRDRPPPPRPARHLRLLARGGRPARSPAGGDRPFRFRPAHPRRRRAGPRRRLHVRDPLEGAHDPRLVRLFDLAVESPYAYWFACRRSALGRRPVRIFHDWLFEASWL